jgi:putative ABC transport system substrate-binding protein
MRRREFIAALGGAAAAWPLTAGAQQPLPVIGFLNAVSPGPWANLLAAFHKGLNETGYVEGRNVTIEYRWAEGKYDRLPVLAADLVRRMVSVIVATGGTPSALAVKSATKTIPVVFTVGADPVSLGLVESLNRPAGNMTGVNLLVSTLGAKRLGLMRDLVPTARLMAMLVNPDNVLAKLQQVDIQQAAVAINQDLRILTASSERELDAAFESMLQFGVQALLVGSDAFFNSRRDKITTLAARHRIPALYEEREFAVAGGLISYGTSISDGYRQAGLYTGRVLRGEKPADLPVVQVTKFELVINLKTAKTLGVKISDNFLTLADEVIE